MSGLENIAKALITSCYLAVGIMSSSPSEMLRVEESSKKEIVKEINKDNDEINNIKTHNESLDDKVVDFEAAKKEFESKRIPVIMLHQIGVPENRYTVSPENYEKMLYDLYVNDFYSVSLKEFAEGNFSNVPIGKKPVLITFDDSTEGQFRLKNDGTICDKSAIGIMEKFYEKHDFGRGGTFFISYGKHNNFVLPFEQNDLASEKMKILVDLGYDVAHHTIFHPDNTHASYNNMFEQHTLSSAMFKYLLGEEKHDEIEIKSFAHPFGASPRNKRASDFLKNNYDLVFDAWGGPSRHPLSERFNHHKIERIELTYNTMHLVHNIRNKYVVTPETNAYYEFVFGEKKRYAQKQNDDLKILPAIQYNKIKSSTTD